MECNAYIHSIARSRAQMMDLATLEEFTAPELVRSLRSDGFELYGESNCSIAEMAFEAAAGALTKGNFAPQDIDAIIIVTESLWDKPQTSTKAPPHIAVRNDLLNQLIVELDLGRAQVYATWTAACGNFAPALNLARALISAGSAGAVLVIVSDRLMPGASRVLESGTAVLSDIAGACVVAGGGGQLLVGEIVLQPVPRMLKPRMSDNFILHARELRTGIATLNQAFARATTLRLDEFDFVVVESFNETIINFFCEQVAIPRERALPVSRASSGHAFSADLLLSLGSIADAPAKYPVGSRFVAVSLSSWMLSASVFEIRDALEPTSVTPSRAS